MQTQFADAPDAQRKLALPDITLVAIDTIAHELTALSIADCRKHATFGDVKLFTNVKGMPHGVYVPGMNGHRALLDFTIYWMPDYIKTSHILVAQWDSWIVDSGMWRPDFLRYDYVGAPWGFTDGMNVGNSGFSILSKALLDFIAARPERFVSLGWSASRQRPRGRKFAIAFQGHQASLPEPR